MRLRSTALRLIGLACLGLSGCETPRPNARIAERAAAFGSLPDETRQAVAKGAIERGYTLEMVYIALGRPDAIEASADARECRWTYHRFYFSPEVMTGPLYSTRSRSKPGAAVGRVFGMAEPAFTSPSSASMRSDAPNSGPPPRASGASASPDVPPVTLDVVFHEGLVTDVFTDPT